MKSLVSIAAVALCLVLSCCGGKNRWTVDGQIDGAQGLTLNLEASNNGMWYQLDSVKIDDDGHFSMSADAAGYPDIYRLRLGDQLIYFPIDSIETITVKAAKGAADYSISGSAIADVMREVDAKVAAVAARKGPAGAAADKDLKRQLAGMLLGDPSGIAAYYIINKRVGDTQLFNPADKGDLRIIGAVANAFVEKRPNDPRTAYLRKLYLSNRNLSAAAADTLVLTEKALVDFSLKDEAGKSVKLSDVASKGNVVALNFTVYDADPSPEFNRHLAAIYNASKAQGFEIVQVAIDDDQFSWLKSAKNLPWITLYAPESSRASILMGYNVGSVPATFIINRRGEIVERQDDVTKLQASVSRYL